MHQKYKRLKNVNLNSYERILKQQKAELNSHQNILVYNIQVFYFISFCSSQYVLKPCDLKLLQAVLTDSFYKLF
jgi:hypothetical protein